MEQKEPRRPNAQVLYGKIQKAEKKIAAQQRKQAELKSLQESNADWLAAKEKQMQFHLEHVDAETKRLYQRLTSGNISTKEMEVLNQSFEYAKHIHALRLAFNATYDRKQKIESLQTDLPSIQEKQRLAEQDLSRFQRWAEEDSNYPVIAAALSSK